jgi:hypothetical protein
MRQLRRSSASQYSIVHGAPYRFADPARFSLAHGGKDRHPFPVPISVYDQTIRVMKTAVTKARLGREEQLAALKRLDDQARRLEGRATGPSFAQLVDQEWQSSHANGGLGDHRQRPYRPGADPPSQQQFGKILRVGIQLLHAVIIDPARHVIERVPQKMPARGELRHRRAPNRVRLSPSERSAT